MLVIAHFYFNKLSPFNGGFPVFAISHIKSPLLSIRNVSCLLIIALFIASPYMYSIMPFNFNTGEVQMEFNTLHIITYNVTQQPDIITCYIITIVSSQQNEDI